jgi:hypothetical protein
VGEFLEEGRASVEEQISEASPLTKPGENLVISWDGAMVPLRSDEETIWKEAAVGRVSVYGTLREEDGKPPLLDRRYFASMPESGMSTLIDQVATHWVWVEVRFRATHTAVLSTRHIELHRPDFR